MGGDWLHVNSVAYNAELDQVMLSVHGFSEVWIIDHSTTTEEAASHSGGKQGKGGDLLYRWGNPRAYRSGSNVDQRLFQQHSAHWIPEGLPGAGHMLVFNNGGNRPDGSYSSVDEVILPLKDDGTYEREEYVAFGPERATWSYSAEDKSSFFSPLISGTQRLPNGNTLICSGNAGVIFEVTSDKEIVWQYKHAGGGPGGFGFPFVPPRPGEVLPDFLGQMLQLTDQQKESLATLQEEVDERLGEILTEEQRDQLAGLEDLARRGPGRGFFPPFGPGFGGPGGGPPGFGGPDGSRGPGGPPNFGRPGDPSRGDDAGNRRRGPRGGPGGPGGGGLFRAYRYAADYPAFDGKELTPGRKLVEVAAANPRPERDRRGRGPRPARPQLSNETDTN
jgi:hypothetical protein